MEANVCQHCGQAAFVVEKEAQDKKGFLYILLGWLFVALSVVFLPLLFGGAALYMGAMTFFDRSRTHGAILMGAAMFATLLGLLFSVFVAGTILI
ncbi:hypothetical protein AM500_05865 [Bacillus sp. FJAT-18017]|uniref:hypothetical protein n=1 Tax=Bacillus sp. FJAT-18017 TaxID=1705566 RepID=UPI0006ADDB16|nr:hypothetical protein [Bacillus sp. FJAT-18017]ALC89360.1 hypothetical protein AM500_05865 [Bacillus sp. FJAT-18017]